MNYKNMRKIARSILVSSIGRFAQISNSVHILNGHHMAGKGQDYYEKIIKQLSESCIFISLPEALELIENKEEINKPLLVFTFDDGIKEMYTVVAPVLEKYGARACFFINPGFIDGSNNYKDHFSENVIKTPGAKPMSWNEIMDLQKRGHIIGSHTYDHLDISSLNEEKLDYQLGESKKFLEKKLNCKIDYFAYPFGQLSHINEKALQIAKKHYTHIFSGVSAGSYYSYGRQVLNRRHIEPFWSILDVVFFLRHKRKY